MAPEACEERCKVLEEEIQMLKLQLAESMKYNQELEGQIIAAGHQISNPSCDVKTEEEAMKDDVISKLLRCHDYFCCDRDQASEQLVQFVSDKVFVDLVEPPGSTHQLEILTILAKIVTLGMIDAVYRLHLEGLSLDGQLACSDFHWMKNKKVKLGSEVREKVQLKSDLSANKDYAALHASINKIFEAAIKKGKKPRELLALLHLMASPDPNGVKVLIRYNMTLMDEIGKKNHFLTMFGRFELLELEEKKGQHKGGVPRSEIVLSYITSGEDDWPDNLCRNKFVYDSHTKHLRDTGYNWNPELNTIDARKKLLEKWRHSLTHLNLNAVEFGKTQFSDVDHAQMLESCTPGVFSQFQEGMHAIGELEYPHLMIALKA